MIFEEIVHTERGKGWPLWYSPKTLNGGGRRKCVQGVGALVLKVQYIPAFLKHFILSNQVYSTRCYVLYQTQGDGTGKS